MKYLHDRMNARRARAEDRDMLCILIPGFALAAFICFLV